MGYQPNDINATSVPELARLLAASPLGASGYSYFVIDGGWSNSMNSSGAWLQNLDGWGRPVPAPERFPAGLRDMTIGVRDLNGALHPMPVIRFDNFSDKTADVRSEEFFLRTGNEDGRALRTTSLAGLLQSPRSYMHDPGSWSGSRTSLWASRDEYVLVSAQACFLPIPERGEATFTPVLYNYQSSPGNPAVMAIMATRELKMATGANFG